MSNNRIKNNEAIENSFPFIASVGVYLFAYLLLISYAETNISKEFNWLGN